MGESMRDFGIVTLLSVIATAAAPTAPASKAATFVTSKSTEQFAGCFSRTQDKRSAAWWYVPNDHGGAFSNLGAASVRQPYFVKISDRGSHRQIELQDAARSGAEAQGVSQCI